MPDTNDINAPSADKLNPGDEAPAGTVGSGEDICPHCHGSGKMEGGKECAICGGTGTIVEGIGGG